jgi:hypothetical protein
VKNAPFGAKTEPRLGSKKRGVRGPGKKRKVCERIARNRN